MDNGVPPFLTVEEAAALLRIGRTKAYALAKEWRATGGRSGLQVVDLGDVLRVPRPALEEMLGAELPATPRTKNGSEGPRASAPKPPAGDTRPAEAPRATPRTRRHHPQPTDQLHLFEPVDTSPRGRQRTSRP